jgi:hypothetical protein
LINWPNQAADGGETEKGARKATRNGETEKGARKATRNGKRWEREQVRSAI